MLVEEMGCGWGIGRSVIIVTVPVYVIIVMELGLLSFNAIDVLLFKSVDVSVNALS